MYGITGLGQGMQIQLVCQQMVAETFNSDKTKEKKWKTKR
jgi:hypothetical protein